MDKLVNYFARESLGFNPFKIACAEMLRQLGHHLAISNVPKLWVGQPIRVQARAPMLDGSVVRHSVTIAEDNLVSLDSPEYAFGAAYLSDRIRHQLGDRLGVPVRLEYDDPKSEFATDCDAFMLTIKAERNNGKITFSTDFGLAAHDPQAERINLASQREKSAFHYLARSLRKIPMRFPVTL